MLKIKYLFKSRHKQFSKVAEELIVVYSLV